MKLQLERIAQLCELLKLIAIHAECPVYAQRAAQEEHSFTDFLEAVRGAERAARSERVRQALPKPRPMCSIMSSGSTVLDIDTRRSAT